MLRPLFCDHRLKAEVASEGPPALPPALGPSSLPTVRLPSEPCPAASARTTQARLPSYTDTPGRLGCLTGPQPYSGFVASCKFKGLSFCLFVFKRKKKKTVIAFEQVSPPSVFAAVLASDDSGFPLQSPVPSRQSFRFFCFVFYFLLWKDFFSLIKISKNISDLAFRWQIQNIWGMMV